ncbi:DapH/DapD/GlmU-related protein [uncultured Brachyspira sp.]|uniref:DapH/DapD/GlmU-related protein n=1 Tax=uncultured Brachyspira sp. TaxID=221953 RepID=UPI002612824F|nr:DapH/DapD/GlmU-related protein [uncultured Brachyspira sp.]
MNVKEFLENYKNGKEINMFSEEFQIIYNKMQETEKLLWQYNNTFQSYKNNRDILNKIFETNLDESVIIMPSFHIDIGNVEFGKNVFINKNCTIMDIGGVIIEDNVQIAHNVSIITPNHDYNNRNILIPKRITIKKNVWIGTAAIILPGVSIGENSIVAAGAVVNKDVPSGTIVGGNPAKVIKEIK